MNIPQEIKPAIEAIISAGGTPCIVGGAVRDFVMGIEPKDYDIEVFDMLQEELWFLLREFGHVDHVGVVFGVLKFTVNGNTYDFTSPRRDSKTGVKHNAFDVNIDPFMSMVDSAKRRDLTMNTLIYDIKSYEVIDSYDGLLHIHNKMIVHTDNETFQDDPLRVLRIFQFAGRFDMDVSLQTQALCQSLIEEYDTLSKERVWTEWMKWAEKSVKPRKGLNFLWQCTWTKKFPQIEQLAYTLQDEKHHPEGNVFQHTMFVCDSMASICERENIVEEDRVVLMLAALCHDFGKVTTTEFVEGKGIRSYGHDTAGEKPTIEFLNSIGCPKHIIDRVVPLVVNHMQHVFYAHMIKSLGDANPEKSKNTFVRKLANKVNIVELSWVAEADHSGRPPIPAHMPEPMLEILEIANGMEIAKSKPQPILMGRHLIEHFGMYPSPLFGNILRAAFERQLEGEFFTEQEGINWLKTNLVDFKVTVKE